MYDTREIAARFARALDRDAFEEARALLDPDCLYRIGGKVLTGPDAILASYREAAEWGHRALDAVEYESVIVESGPGHAVIEFIDHLQAGGERYTHRSEQRVTVNASGRIAHIEHRDLAGERAALDAFFARAGVKRGE